MSLRIGQLDTTCHTPEQRRDMAGVVDRLARSRFARDLVEHLGPSLARQPAIVRIRRLALRVVIPASEFSEDSLSLAWRQAFGKALFTALAYPAGAGPVEVYCADSVAAFIASAVSDLLNGTAANEWQYAEFEQFFRRGSTQAALGLICEWPPESLPVLVELARRGILPRLLGRFDEIAMQHLFSVLPGPFHSETGLSSVDDLITAARLALANPPEKAIGLRSRSYALLLFVESHRTGGMIQSPRALFHALVALAVLLNPSVFWPDVPPWAVVREKAGLTAWPLESAGFPAHSMLATVASPQWREMLHREALATRLPPNVTAFLDRLSNEIQYHWQSSASSHSRDAQALRSGHHQLQGLRESDLFEAKVAELNQLLTSLAAQLKVPSPLPRLEEVHWMATEYCGLFFLIDSLARRGWTPEWEKLSTFRSGGVACLLTGLALAIVERFDASVQALDPAIALFAGYLGDPDLAHLRRVFQTFPREVRVSVLEATIPIHAVEDAAESWASTFDRLAALLLEDFASRIRGFRQATRQTVVRSFIARPGRIRVERERVVVYPSPNPFHVALHISGQDDPIASGVWIGGLRIDFELGAL